MKRIRVERVESGGWITLARPEKKNALDRLMADELHAALQELEGDDSVRVVAVAGDGDDFCAGADLQALEGMLEASPEAHREDAAALGRVFLDIRAMTKPVVAIIQGRALAGGAGLATACDIVLAHEDAQFGYPEVKVGFVPAMVMTMLRRSTGEKQAFELVASGRILSAHEAYRIGLVSRVLAAEAFEAQVGAIITDLCRAPRTALAFTKRLFYALDDLDFPEGIELGVSTNAAARQTDDFRRGVQRFTSRTRATGGDR